MLQRSLTLTPSLFHMAAFFSKLLVPPAPEPATAPPTPIPVHSLLLSSHLLYCISLLFVPFTTPRELYPAMPEDLEMWPSVSSYHLRKILYGFRTMPVGSSHFLKFFSREAVLLLYFNTHFLQLPFIITVVKLIWAASWQSQRNGMCAQRRLRLSLSIWRKLGFLATHWAHSEDSAQTGRIPRLIWVFARRSSFYWFCHEAARLVFREWSYWLISYSCLK